MKKASVILAAVLALSCAATVSGCSGSIKDLENNVSNAVSNVTSNLQNNPVTSAWGEVNSAQVRLDAAKLNDCLFNFYAGVIAGSINEDSAGYLVTAPLPAANAANSAKKSAANQLTVFSAIEWQGMQSLFTEDYLTNFVFDGTNVVAKDNGNKNESSSITADTTLGTLFNK